MRLTAKRIPTVREGAAHEGSAWLDSARLGSAGFNAVAQLLRHVAVSWVCGDVEQMPDGGCWRHYYYAGQTMSTARANTDLTLSLPLHNSRWVYHFIWQSSGERIDWLLDWLIGRLIAGNVGPSIKLKHFLGVRTAILILFIHTHTDTHSHNRTCSTIASVIIYMQSVETRMAITWAYRMAFILNRFPWFFIHM